MSISAIRASLESAVNSIIPAIDTAWENVSYTPAPGVKYQRVSIVFAAPNNQEYGSSWQDIGILFINLYFPKQTGSGDTDARCELIRSKFARGTTFTSGGAAVTINGTPELTPAYNDGEYFVRTVRIPFYSNQY